MRSLASAACSPVAASASRTARAACGGGDDDNFTPPADGGVDSGVDAAPVCSNGRVVYLNFGGVTLTSATTSDATQNRASWMTITQGTAPPFKSGATNRDQLIKDITDGVRGQLSSFPITVVTQRPATGPYVMIVIGGTSTQVGSRFGAAVTTLDCGDAQKSDLAWISENLSTQRTVNSAVGAIGFGLGLTATTDPRDCMCSWDNNCTPDNTQPCRDGGHRARSDGAAALRHPHDAGRGGHVRRRVLPLTPAVAPRAREAPRRRHVLPLTRSRSRRRSLPRFAEVTGSCSICAPSCRFHW